MSEVSYIVNSDKPYPTWIKEHRVFKALPKIDKIFPRIGLPNFSQAITVFSTEAARANARQIVYFVSTELGNRMGTLTTKLMKEMNELPSREKNEKCNALQNVINITTALYTSFAGREMSSVVEGKVILSIPADVFSGASSTPVFKKGEALFKVLTKINSMLDSALTGNYKINYENNNYFKEFSKLNLPNKDYKMVFSSTGPEGAWDIATASMRGIASCQTWTAAQSRGLIGSISSKYVGIVYIEGSTDYPPYGKQMMFRSLIRLVINRANGVPALYMDTMYPSPNPDVFATMKSIIEERSGLKVYSSSFGDGEFVLRDYHLLDEVSRSYLREGEYSYMDSTLSVEKRKVPILFDVENKTLTERRSFFIDKLGKTIAEKRACYSKNIADLKAFVASGEKDESKKPEMAPAFNDLKKGQYAFQNILNFFKHCETNPGTTTNNPTSYFLTEIFRAIGNPEQSFASKKECDVWVLRNLINNYAEIESKSWDQLNTGSWIKAFPSSAKRFHETVLTDLKKELLIACKRDA